MTTRRYAQTVTVLAACAYALSAMDVMIMEHAIRKLPEATRLSNLDIILIGTAPLVASAFSGWLAGMLADRMGRVLTFRLMIGLLAVSTLACACMDKLAPLLGLSQAHYLFMARALVGAGFGGQWAAGAIIVAEVVGPPHRGFAVGFMQSGWAIGWACAEALGQSGASWRELFLVTASLAVPILLWSWSIEDSRLFMESRSRLAAAGERIRSLRILTPGSLRTTAKTSAISIGAMIGYWVIVYWHNPLPALRADSATLQADRIWIILAGAWVGYVVGAFLTDLIGRSWTFIGFAFGALVTALIVFGTPHSPEEELEIGTVGAIALLFFTSGTFAGTGACFAELFKDTSLRGSGVGMSYNFGRGIAAVVLWLVPLVPAGLASDLAIRQEELSILAFVVPAYVIVIGAAWFLPRTGDGELTPRHSGP